MAYIIAQMDQDEMNEVQAMRFELEEAPDELVPRESRRSKSSHTKMVWVNCSMVDLLKPVGKERGDVQDLLKRAADALLYPGKASVYTRKLCEELLEMAKDV
jgi:hypothetical protein